MVTDANLRDYFARQVEAFQPDVILASTDDSAQLLLEVALRSPNARVVYLARATLALPFGPDCAFPSEAKTERIRAADAVIGVSQYVADYIREHASIGAVHVPISLMESDSIGADQAGLAGSPIRDTEQDGQARVLAMQSSGMASLDWSPDRGRLLAAGDRLIVLATRHGLGRYLSVH